MYFFLCIKNNEAIPEEIHKKKQSSDSEVG